MKIKRFLTAAFLCAAVILTPGCKKKENVVSETTNMNTDGIYNTSVSDEYKEKISQMKNEFSDSFKDFNKDKAIAEDMAVICDGEEAIKAYKIKEFCDSILKNQPAEVKIAVFNKDEKNVIIKILKYDTNRVYGYFDMRNYKYSNEEYLDFSYPHCELFEQPSKNNKIHYLMYLTDEDDYTFEEIMNMNTDTDDAEMGKCVYVCSYTE